MFECELNRDEKICRTHSVKLGSYVNPKNVGFCYYPNLTFLLSSTEDRAQLKAFILAPDSGLCRNDKILQKKGANRSLLYNFNFVNLEIISLLTLSSLVVLQME